MQIETVADGARIEGAHDASRFRAERRGDVVERAGVEPYGEGLGAGPDRGVGRGAGDHDRRCAPDPFIKREYLGRKDELVGAEARVREDEAARDGARGIGVVAQ